MAFAIDNSLRMTVGKVCNKNKKPKKKNNKKKND